MLRGPMRTRGHGRHRVLNSGATRGGCQRACCGDGRRTERPTTGPRTGSLPPPRLRRSPSARARRRTTARRPRRWRGPTAADPHVRRRCPRGPATPSPAAGRGAGGKLAGASTVIVATRATDRAPMKTACWVPVSWENRCWKGIDTRNPVRICRPVWVTRSPATARSSSGRPRPPRASSLLSPRRLAAHPSMRRTQRGGRHAPPSPWHAARLTSPSP